MYSGYILFCNKMTLGQCVSKRQYTCSDSHRNEVEAIKQGSILFMYGRDLGDRADARGRRSASSRWIRRSPRSRPRYHDILMQHPEHPARERSGGQGRDRERDRADWGEPRQVRLRARAALGAGDRAGHHRLRPRQQDRRQRVHPLQGPRREAGAVAHQLDARRAHHASTATRRSSRRSWSTASR